MDKTSTETEDHLKDIWRGDLLGRRSEADLLQRYIEAENATFLRTDRQSSVVLSIDAEYGQGKSWFLDRLASQLSLTHPVARIDAWADDASEEPLTAFMSSIDDALAPFLTTSKKLSDKLAKAKIAALPVMGRLLKGVMVKGLTKVAGDQADEALGEAFEGAIESARESNAQETGAIAEAVGGAMEEIGKEIESLVDRRGAAMLAEYRQRRKSRIGFRRNMEELVSAIDESECFERSPLIIIVDELDRCRPDYAIKVLEEIKHFFEVPGVVFILAVHGDQLTASIEAVYGQKFDAKAYMQRFFTRKYKMRRLSLGEIVNSYMSAWDDRPKFLVLPLLESGSEKTPGVEGYLAKLMDEYDVSPREAYPILDALRLFALDTDEHETIHLHALMHHLVRLVRGIERNGALQGNGSLNLASFSISGQTRTPQRVRLSEFLERWSVWGHEIEKARFQRYGHSAPDNLAKNVAEGEFSRRIDKQGSGLVSVTNSYADRVAGIIRLSRDVFPLEMPTTP